ncbi:hypothetical protein L6452_08670 [Arctium lappa]|uniref:Uncharacterized protein n=1 Tax=Arctium lappa TaxID=4217 RepID=A0ACB9DJ14_ARCLA|nr:hypothetical protein L6452_08670 [Arctium lappa]
MPYRSFELSIGSHQVRNVGIFGPETGTRALFPLGLQGKEMEVRLKGISMGSGGGVEAMVGMLSASASGWRPDPVVLVEEIEPKEWVAQGILITFISLPRGGLVTRKLNIHWHKILIIRPTKLPGGPSRILKVKPTYYLSTDSQT